MERHIKPFDLWLAENAIDETMDMMTMPVDPIKGAADVYRDVAKALGSKFKEATLKIDVAVESTVKELGSKAAQVLKSIEHYFGAPSDKLTYDMIVAKLESSNESLVDRYDAADPYNGHEEGMHTSIKDVKGGIIHKIGNILQNICGINILTFGLLGSFLTWLLNIATVNPAMSMIYSIVGFVIVHIIRKLATMAGH